MQRVWMNLGLAAVCAIAIVACSNSTPTAETKPEAKTEVTKTEATKTEASKTGSSPAKKDDHAHKGDHKEGDHKEGGKDNHAHGEVVEVDGYHLELSAHKEAKATHMDLLLQKGEKHESVTDAKVTAQIQLPDGSSKNLDLVYQPGEKVYGAEIADLPAGNYKVAVLSEIAGKKVNARFNLKI